MYKRSYKILTKLEDPIKAYLAEKYFATNVYIDYTEELLHFTIEYLPFIIPLELLKDFIKKNPNCTEPITIGLLLTELDRWVVMSLTKTLTATLGFTKPLLAIQ